MAENRGPPPTEEDDDLDPGSPLPAVTRTDVENRRIRDVLLKDFQEIRVEEIEPAEDPFTIAFAFVAGVLLLAGIAFWKNSQVPMASVERQEIAPRSSLPRPAGNPSFLSGPAPIRTTSPRVSPRAAAAVTPSPSPTLSLSLAEAVEAVRNDEVCAVISAANQDAVALLMALPGFQSLSPDSQAAIRSASGQSPQEKLDAYRSSNSDWAQFQEALMRAGMLSASGGEVDLPRAKQILQRLAGQFSDNGAFAFYLVGVLQKLGSDPAELDDAILQMARAATFDTGTESVYREVRNQFSGTVSENIVALGAVASAPVPDFQTSLNVITTRLRERPELAEQVHEASQRFRTDEGLMAAGTEMFDWSASEIDLFTSIGRVAWSQFSKEPFPAATAGPFLFQSGKDLPRMDPETSAETPGTYYGLIEQVYQGGSCEADPIREAYSRLLSR